MSKSSRHLETGLFVLFVMLAPPHPLLLTVLFIRRSHVLVGMTFKTNKSDVCVLATVQFNPPSSFSGLCVGGYIKAGFTFYSHFILIRNVNLFLVTEKVRLLDSLHTERKIFKLAFLC